MESVIGNQKIEHWVAIRILNFLNTAQSASDIVRMVKDDPSAGAPGQGVGIGETVAARILERRDSLKPFGRFTQISELEGIAGLGADKIRDLIYTFDVRAAEAFHQRLFNGILLDNWKVLHHSTFFDTDKAFRQVAYNDCHLYAHLAAQIEQIACQRPDNHGSRVAQLAGLLAKQCYLDRYDTSAFGAYAFTLWWYKFDQDNWFSFEQMREAVGFYLDYYAYFNAANEQQLVLLKGFPNSLALGLLCPVAELPVVLNPIERGITVWTAELYD